METPSEDASCLEADLVYVSRFGTSQRVLTPSDARRTERGRVEEVYDGEL